jgi:hypothetical protein
MERLKRHGNFMAWRARAKAVLIENDLFEYVSTPKVTVQADADMKKKDQKCKARILFMIEADELALSWIAQTLPKRPGKR